MCESVFVGAHYGFYMWPCSLIFSKGSKFGLICANGHIN